jgi:hypothetical protein
MRIEAICFRHINILREIIENISPFPPEFGRPFFILGASQDALLANLLGEAWSGAGKGTRLKWLLCGIGNASIDTNINLFLSVQKFIIDSSRFTRSST